MTRRQVMYFGVFKVPLFVFSSDVCSKMFVLSLFHGAKLSIVSDDHCAPVDCGCANSMNDEWS